MSEFLDSFLHGIKLVSPYSLWAFAVYVIATIQLVHIRFYTVAAILGGATVFFLTLSIVVTNGLRQPFLWSVFHILVGILILVLTLRIRGINDKIILLTKKHEQEFPPSS